MTSSTFCQHVGNTMDEGTAAGVLPQRRPSPRLERDSRQFFHGGQSLVLPRSRLTQLLSNNLFPLLKRLEGILNYCRTKGPMGEVEAMNGNIKALFRTGTWLRGSKLFVTERPTLSCHRDRIRCFSESRARMRTHTNSRAEPDFHGFSFSLSPWPFKQCYLYAPVVFSKILEAHPDFRHFSDLRLAFRALTALGTHYLRWQQNLSYFDLELSCRVKKSVLRLRRQVAGPRSAARSPLQ